MNLINFDECRQLNKGYAGANGKKICVVYNDEKYMIKFPTSSRFNSGIHYSSAIFSEHIGSTIFNKLGINAQKTLIGNFKCGDKLYTVCACKDFEYGAWSFKDFACLKNQTIDSETNGKNCELETLLETIEIQERIDNNLLISHFWKMFIIDCYINNMDRHNGNWGFLYNNDTDELKIAPVFDCGSSLYPAIDINMINDVLNDNVQEINVRLYDRARSAIKENGKRIFYHEFLKNTDNLDCVKALGEMLPKIQELNIDEIIDPIPNLPQEQKLFYKKMLNLRKDKILVPAYKSAVVRGLINDRNHTSIQKNKLQSQSKSPIDRAKSASKSNTTKNWNINKDYR